MGDDMDRYRHCTSHPNPKAKMMLPMRTHVKFSELTLLVVLALIPTFQRFPAWKIIDSSRCPQMGVSRGPNKARRADESLGS